jgi:hypothetical protein
MRGEYSKMRVEDERPMTAELAARTESYIKWKHRPREVVEVDGKTGKRHWVIRTPTMRQGDLLFAPFRFDSYTGPVATLATLYNEYSQGLRSLVDSMDNNGRFAERVSPNSSENWYSPRRFTFYRLRDHAKTTIADQGFHDYSEWFILHTGSTYYQQTEKKRAEVFAKVEPSLTYLDTLAPESKHADVESKLQQSQEGYQRLAQELKEQRQQAELLAQQLKQQQEEWEQQQNRMDDRFREYDSVMRQVLLQQSSQQAKTEFAEGLLKLVRKQKPKEPEEMREGLLRFVERRSSSSSSRMNNNNSRSNRRNSSDKNNRSNHHDKRMGKKV